MRREPARHLGPRLVQSTVMVQHEADCVAEVPDMHRTEFLGKGAPEGRSEAGVGAKFLLAGPLTILVVADDLAEQIAAVGWRAASDRLRKVIHHMDGLDGVGAGLEP